MSHIPLVPPPSLRQRWGPRQGPAHPTELWSHHTIHPDRPMATSRKGQKQGQSDALPWHSGNLYLDGTTRILFGGQNVAVCGCLLPEFLSAACFEDQLPFTFHFDVQRRKKLLKNKPFLLFVINISHSLLL